MEPFFPMLKALAARTDLSMPAKGVHACLTAYSGMNKTYPSQGRMAKDLGLSSKTIYRAVKELEAAGLVSVTRGRQGVSSTYHIGTLVNESIVNQSTMDNQSRANESTIVKESISPSSTSPYRYGQDDELIEASIEAVEASASDAESMTHAERLQWLREALGNFNPGLGLPDVAITKRIKAAAAGASQDAIGSALHRLYASGLPDRMRSWGLMVKALPEELTKLKASRRREPERGSDEALIRGEVAAGRMTREQASSYGVHIEVAA